MLSVRSPLCAQRMRGFTPERAEGRDVALWSRDTERRLSTVAPRVRNVFERRVVSAFSSTSDALNVSPVFPPTFILDVLLTRMKVYLMSKAQ